MKIAAIGRTELLYNSILELEKSGHRIVLIITSRAEQNQYEMLISHILKEDEIDILRNLNNGNKETQITAYRSFLQL